MAGAAYRDKVAVITGACGGLGSALARNLADSGCHLALVDINEHGLKQLANQLSIFPVRCSTHVCNIGDPEAVAALAEAVSREHGQLNLLINNAGITLQKSAANHSWADWQRVFNVNWWGTVNCCTAFTPLLKQQDGAHIVNLSSMAAYYGLPSQASYSASKAAVQAYSESLRAELAAEHIGVTSIHPGAIKTGMMTATLTESDNIAQAEKNYSLATRWGLPPEVVAQKILDAAQKNRRQRRIGLDAHMLFFVARTLPSLLGKLLAKTFAKSLASTAQ